MVEGDAPWPLAAGARGQHVLARPDGAGRGPRDAGKGRDVEDADGNDGVDNAGTENRRQHDGRQNSREGKGEVGQPHDQLLQPAAARRRQQAQRGAHRQADADRDQANQNRVARTHQQQGGDIAAKRVGAQPMLPIGRLQFDGHVHLVGRPGRPDQRQAGRQQQQQRQHAADHEAAVRQRAAGEAGRAHMSLAFTRGSITAYSTSTTKFTTITMVASSITQLRTTIRSRLEIDWKISRPSPGR